jgi:hypothetical protein
MAAFTVATAFTQFGIYKKDISDVADAEKLQWAQQVLNYIYQEFVKVDPERWITTDTVSAVSGTATYSLPSDFLHIQSVGCGLYKQNSDGYATDERLTMTGYGSSTTGFYISGGNIVLTPPDWSETQTYILRYIPNPFAFTATTEYFTSDGTNTGTTVIDSQYMDYVIKAIDVLYSQWDADPGSESIADHRFMNVLNSILVDIRREGASYALPDMSLSF